MSADKNPEGLERLFSRDPEEEERSSPFGDETTTGSPGPRFRAAVTRLRRLRAQVSAEGLSPAATRSLLDELIKALEALDEMGARGR